MSGQGVLAIDPGTEKSAYVVYDGQQVPYKGIVDNQTMCEMLRGQPRGEGEIVGRCLAIEMVASYGMPVGKDVFQTVLWIGRFIEAWGGNHELIYRKDVKMHFCYQTKGVNDSVIRQALIDRFGPGRKKAVGRKKDPGPLYGVKDDIWQALAVAVTWYDQQKLAEARS